MNRFEIFIGSRYMRSPRQSAFISLITFLSITGVALGVATLIVVLAVMTGYEKELTARILGVESHVRVMRYGGPITNYRPFIDRIRKIAGVRSAAPFVYGQVMLRSSSGVAGAVLRGIDPTEEADRMAAFDADALNRLKDRPGADRPGIPDMVLGRELAEKLKVSPGDVIFLTAARRTGNRTAKIPSSKRVRVAGSFEIGMYEFDATLAYMDLRDAQRILGMGYAVTGIEVMVDVVDKADIVSRAIQDDFGFPFSARDWKRQNRNLFSMLKLQKVVLFIILTLIILVAAFNIASALIMMVIEKTKDIAILRAMGATTGSIRNIFVFKGMVIGSAGTLIGLGTGFVLCFLLKAYPIIEIPGDVYYLNTLPISLQAFDTLAIAGAALLISYLSTLYPARQAANLDPVEGFRYG